MSAAMARGSHLPLVPRGFSNWISREILTSNYPSDLGDLSAPCGRTVVPLQASIHGCTDTFSTSERGDLGTGLESKHTTSCVLKAVGAGRVHGTILADCLTAAGKGLNPLSHGPNAEWG